LSHSGIQEGSPADISQAVTGSTTISRIMLGVGNFIWCFSGAWDVVRLIGNRSRLTERFTVWPEYISLFVLVSRKPIASSDGATWCAAIRKPATPTTHGSEYKVTLFARMTTLPVCLNSEQGAGSKTPMMPLRHCPYSGHSRRGSRVPQTSEMGQ
jgi:hypothetical protein